MSLQATESSGKSRALSLPSTCFRDCYPCLMNGKVKGKGTTSSVRDVSSALLPKCPVLPRSG